MEEIIDHRNEKKQTTGKSRGGGMRRRRISAWKASHREKKHLVFFGH